jgi:hypothetical protein
MRKCQRFLLPTTEDLKDLRVVVARRIVVIEIRIHKKDAGRINPNETAPI